ncbi:MAG: hypothetical protein QNJ22_10870 [Desulfosarcinaceae bacterium]|nr:hypothetical protein [Desulfosarcinaceae bacterium]
MGHKQQLNRLAKFLTYVLGCRPDEFGLIPDADGYVKIKQLLQALSEESGWRHVRQAHLRELTISLPNCPVEIEAHEIRARDRSRLQLPSPKTAPPKLLYTHVRQKAYGYVAEKGIQTRGTPIILCANQDMAARIGRRRDRGAVQLTVNTSEVLAKGVDLRPCGEGLFQADYLPHGCFTGPPMPKTPPSKSKPTTAPTSEPPAPGSFFVNLETPGVEKRKRGTRRKDQAWKKERRRRQRNDKDKWA